MERYALHKWTRLCKIGVGVSSPCPRSRESLFDVCQELFDLAAELASGEKKLVLNCSVGGNGYKLDFCGAKAATFICAIGIGFGLGSYLLYKLYKSLFPGDSDDKEEDSPKKNQSYHCKNKDNAAVCPKSSENDMGNSGSSETVPVRYDSVNGVQFGSCNSYPTRNQATSPIHVRHRKHSKHHRSYRANSQEEEVKLLSSQDDSLNYEARDVQERLIHSASDVSDGPICGSLKGNLSLKSLYERNCKYGFDEKVSAKNELSDSTADSIHIDVSQDLLTVSSVLLTPPSDDDRHQDAKNIRSQELSIASDPENKPSVKFSENIPDLISNLSCNASNQGHLDDIHDPNVTDPSSSVWQTTDSSNHTSPFHSSGSAKLFSNYTTDVSGNLSLEEDEQDSSPLHKAKCAEGFRNTLLHRLQEINGTSTSSSLNSSPDVSPYHQGRGCRAERQDSLSGLSALSCVSENELFSGSSQVGIFTGECFEDIEHQVDEITDEFADITAKLAQLKELAAKHTSDEDFDFEYTPSDPLSRKACEIVEKTREKLHRSQSDTSLSESLVEIEGVDLSWDSEGISQVKQSFKRVSSLPPQMMMESQSECDEYDEKEGNSKNSGDMVNGNHSDINFSKSTTNSNGAIMFLTEKCSKCGQSNSESDMQCECSYAQGQTTLDELDTDSAFEVDASDIISSRELSPGSINIGPKQNILEYAEKEWQGKTRRASVMKKAYKEIPALLGCQNLQQIRGDNYCGIRGALFQCLCNNTNILTKWGTADSVIVLLTRASKKHHSGLLQWTFANRLPYNKRDVLSTMSACIQCLFSTIEESQSLTCPEERLNWTMNLLNRDTHCDLQCMEAIKVLMYLTAVDVYERSLSGSDVPVFVWLLFARDTSENPTALLKNHINPIGDSAGLEQIEMFLLGYTLGVTIQVFRLQQYEDEDFVTYYPDDKIDTWPKIALIAEDDRHYNVPVA